MHQIVGERFINILNLQKNFYEANEYCMDKFSTTLATVMNLDEHNMIGDDSWIGLYKPARYANFRWLGSIQSGYRNWAPGQPDTAGGIEFCVDKWGAWDKWNDRNCNDVRKFTCNAPYYFGRSTVSFQGGIDHCNINRNQLASIRNKYENGIFKEMCLKTLTNKDCWLGFSRNANADAVNGFQFLDGTTKGYLPWNPGICTVNMFLRNSNIA